MSQRRILLIDNDRAFHRLVSDQIGPYGFEVIPASPADPDVLAKVTQLDPAIVIIAVDEPDKVGYSLCNKAKKGVAANLPVILATSTVTPAGFANHRKLKLHADEYIDKRGLNPAEVVGKIDNLIGLGELRHDVVASTGEDEFDELQVPVEVEDMALDLADAEVVEQLDDDFESEGASSHGREANPTDSMLEADLDGAFAAITDFADEGPRSQAGPAPKVPLRAGPVTEPPPLPASPAHLRGGPALAPVEELEVAAPGSQRAAVVTPDPHPSDYVVEEASMGIPEPIDSQSHDDLEVQEVPGGEWAGEVPEPIDMGDFGDEERTSAGGPPVSELLATDLAQPVIDLPDEPVPEPVPEPLPEPEPVPPPPEPIAAAPAAEPLPEPAPPAPPADAGIDLGLDEIAARADAEQSGVHDRRVLQKLHGLERDNARLKAELDKARQSAADGGKAQGREREFLHLREMIATKDREITELRDELLVKDRQISDGKEKLRHLQHTKTQLEGKNLELEQRMVGDADKVEAAEAARKELEVKLADATARLAAVEAKAKNDADAATRALAERTEKASQLDRELSAARARLGESEHKHAEALAGVAKARDAAEAQLRIELELAKNEAIAALRAELGDQKVRELGELADRHAAAIAQREQDRAAAIAAVESASEVKIAEVAQRHQAELEELRAEGERAVAAAQARAEEALAAERARAAEALAAERARADQAVADAAAHVQEVAAAERARAEKAIAEAQGRAQDDMMAVVAAHQGEMEKSAAEHQRSLDALRTTLEGQLAQTRAAAISERDRLVAEHGTAIAVLTGDRDKVQAELDETHIEAERLRGDLAALADRARKDLEAAQQERERAIAEVRAEKAEVERGLSGARDRIKRMEEELQVARDTITARERDVDAQAAAVAERDQRIAQLRGELDELERENSGYQEQVLKAYQKIKSDEATVTRAKKAMAIALTLLDEEKKGAQEGS